MKIVLVGVNGAIGQAVQRHLGERHTIIGASRTNAELKIDMTDSQSIRSAFESVGNFDALIVAAGAVAFNTFPAMTDDEWQLGLDSKLMGQVKLAQIALDYLNPHGSITLTSGVTSKESIAMGASSSMANSALESFVRAASTELPNHLRMNIVNPTVLEESVGQYGEYFLGFEPVSSTSVGYAYQRSVEGVENGRTYEVF
ncbi:short chain dehydrogenase [Marinobacter bohaiensis]|uniref:short chain dehydrogenase n=1 Tax=Marinobacter bohaiensis TaxID=2201898 RepID=UPI000DAE5438|nr:short chain dehydrogenase [Marinobacter bohaiensis]